MLRKRSPLMLHVVLEQVRRARVMGLADDLRMERDMVRHCFNTVHLGRSGSGSETVEGHPRAGGGQGPQPALESAAHRGRDAGDGGAVLRQPVAGARPPLAHAGLSAGRSARRRPLARDGSAIARFHGPLDLALAFAVLDGVALVVLGLAFGQSRFRISRGRFSSAG